MRIAVSGKGGAGKSMIAATLARLLARGGSRVLALDSDPQPGLALSLGIPPADEPTLEAVTETDAHGRWRLREGMDAAEAVARCAVEAPDGVRLLQASARTCGRFQPVMNRNSPLYALVHRLAAGTALNDWVLIGDLAGGPRQAAFDWAPYADRFLVVAEPTWQSMLAARRIGRIIGANPSVGSALVVNRVREPGDVRQVEDFLGRRAVGVVPEDEAVSHAERRGAAVLDEAPGSEAVRAVARLAIALRGASLAA